MCYYIKINGLISFMYFLNYSRAYQKQCNQKVEIQREETTLQTSKKNKKYLSSTKSSSSKTVIDASSQLSGSLLNNKENIEGSYYWDWQSESSRAPTKQQSVPKGIIISNGDNHHGRNRAGKKSSVNLKIDLKKREQSTFYEEKFKPGKLLTLKQL